MPPGFSKQLLDALGTTPWGYDSFTFNKTDIRTYQKDLNPLWSARRLIDHLNFLERQNAYVDSIYIHHLLRLIAVADNLPPLPRLDAEVLYETNYTRIHTVKSTSTNNILNSLRGVDVDKLFSSDGYIHLFPCQLEEPQSYVLLDVHPLNVHPGYFNMSCHIYDPVQETPGRRKTIIDQIISHLRWEKAINYFCLGPTTP